MDLEYLLDLISLARFCSIGWGNKKQQLDSPVYHVLRDDEVYTFNPVSTNMYNCIILRT